MKKVFICLAIASMSALVAGPPAHAEGLNQHAIRALFPGTFDVSFKRKTSFVVTARADGSLVGKMAGVADQGSWSIRGEKLCIAFSKWNEGKSKCKRVFLEDGWIRSGTFFFKRR